MRSKLWLAVICNIEMEFKYVFDQHQALIDDHLIHQHHHLTLTSYEPLLYPLYSEVQRATTFT